MNRVCLCAARAARIVAPNLLLGFGLKNDGWQRPKMMKECVWSSSSRVCEWKNRITLVRWYLQSAFSLNGMEHFIAFRILHSMVGWMAWLAGDFLSIHYELVCAFDISFWNGIRAAALMHTCAHISIKILSPPPRQQAASSSGGNSNSNGKVKTNQMKRIQNQISLFYKIYVHWCIFCLSAYIDVR